MRLFASPRAIGAGVEDAPLSKWVFLCMLCLIGVMGLIVVTEAEFPGYVLLALGGMGMILLFLLSLARPEIPLYVMAAYLPFSKQLAGDFGGFMTAFNVTNMLLAIIILGWFTGTTTGRQPIFEGHRLHWPVGLMAGWGVLGFLVMTFKYGGWYFTGSLDELKRWLDPILLYFLFFHLVQDRQRWKNLVVIMMASVVVVALMSIWEYQDLISGAGSLERARVRGITDSPNSLGAFFVYYMFLFAAFWLERGKPRRRWWLLILFLLCFRGIMVTFSRGAYLAFAAGCLVLTFVRSKRLFLLVALAMGMMVLTPSLLPKGIHYRLVESTFKDPNTQLLEVYGAPDLETRIDRSAGLRLIIWRGARGIIADHPVFGLGFGGFMSQIHYYAGLRTPRDAHNAYLLAAAEQGLPMVGLICLLLLMLGVVTYRVARHASDPFIRTTALGWLGGLCALAVANIFGSRMNSAEINGYFWILAALMARAHIWMRKEMARQRVLVRASRVRGQPMQPALAARTAARTAARSGSRRTLP